MTDLRTAAQQALEAMEAAEVDPHSSDAVYRAIAALKAALAEPGYPLGKATTDVGVPVYVVKKAEPVQDPVASLMTNIQSGDMEVVWNDDGFDRELWHETPLYTAPPQRKRKPLSDEELRALYNQCAAYQEEGPEASGWWGFARAIERAHGIGGQDEP